MREHLPFIAGHVIDSVFFFHGRSDGIGIDAPGLDEITAIQQICRDQDDAGDPQ